MFIPYIKGRHRTGVMLAHHEKKRPPTYVWKSVFSVVRPNAKLLILLLFLLYGKIKIFAQKIRSKASCVMKKNTITQQFNKPYSHFQQVKVREERKRKMETQHIAPIENKNSTEVLPLPVTEFKNKHPVFKNSFFYEDALKEVVKEATKWLLQYISKTIKLIIQTLKRRRRFRRKKKK